MEIEQGLTQKGVNKCVVQILKSQFSHSEPQTWLDIPCGEAKFIKYVTANYPHIQFYGADKYAKPVTDRFQFFQESALDFLRNQSLPQFDGITCISGVMCFDGIEEIFQQFENHLKPQGSLVVTNDNVMAARDRLHFFLFGRVKRFRLFYSKSEGNWNLVFPQALYMFFKRHHIQNIQVKYVSYYWEDLIFLPLAILLYLTFLPAIFMGKGELSLKERFQLFPFAAMMARHYIIWGQKS